MSCTPQSKCYYPAFDDIRIKNRYWVPNIYTKISFIHLYKVMLQSLQVMLQLLQVSMLGYIHACIRN